MSEGEHHKNLLSDIKELPSWVWLGAVGIGAILYLITKRGAGSTLTGGGTASTDTSGQQASTGGVSMADVLAAIHQAGTQTNPAVSVPPSPVTPPSGTVQPGGQELTPVQQQQMGPYGGSPVQTANPFAGIPGWEGVSATQYSGGGTLLNLGTAQPAPQPGQVIPPAVQDQVVYNPNGTPNWDATLKQAYQYPQGFTPGMTQ
jgi:hypothetical protein